MQAIKSENTYNMVYMSRENIFYVSFASMHNKHFVDKPLKLWVKKQTGLCSTYILPLSSTLILLLCWAYTVFKNIPLHCIALKLLNLKSANTYMHIKAKHWPGTTQQSILLFFNFPSLPFRPTSQICVNYLSCLCKIPAMKR